MGGARLEVDVHPALSAMRDRVVERGRLGRRADDDDDVRVLEPARTVDGATSPVMPR